jgi:hypothetical protein
VRYSAPVPQVAVRCSAPYADDPVGDPMTPDPDRKPTKEEMRQGGRVAALVLIFLALFTTVFIWIA